ncbi:Hypothetical predicted protein, partial [Marmota monax]
WRDTCLRGSAGPAKSQSLKLAPGEGSQGPRAFSGPIGAQSPPDTPPPGKSNRFVLTHSCVSPGAGASDPKQ